MDLVIDIKDLIQKHGNEVKELHERLILAEAKNVALTKKVLEMQAAMPNEYYNPVGEQLTNPE